VSALLTHTPLWVWAILALLVERGLAAARPNRITPGRLLLLPLVFSVAGAASLAHTGALLPVAVAAAAIGLVIGGAAGWAVFAAQDGYQWHAGMLQRPGSWRMLACSVAAFLVKFGVATAMGWQPALAAGTSGALLAGIVTGAASGLLWGACATQLLLGRATVRTLTILEA